MKGTTSSRKSQTGDRSRAVAYLRVSRDEQNLGPEAQRAGILSWAARNGVDVVSWHEDRLSGATPVEDRPGLLEALASLVGREAGILVASKRDRLAADAGAKVVTADGVSADDTPEGALMRTLLDAFAQYERSMIRARTRAALQAKRARGEKYTRKAPLGFRFDGGRLVDDADERAVLGRIRELRERGMSLSAIVTKLNAEGSTCRGGRWHATTISRTLRRAA